MHDNALKDTPSLRDSPAAMSAIDELSHRDRQHRVLLEARHALMMEAAVMRAASGGRDATWADKWLSLVWLAYEFFGATADDDLESVIAVGDAMRAGHAEQVTARWRLADSGLYVSYECAPDSVAYMCTPGSVELWARGDPKRTYYGTSTPWSMTAPDEPPVGDVAVMRTLARRTDVMLCGMSSGVVWTRTDALDLVCPLGPAVQYEDPAKALFGALVPDGPGGMSLVLYTVEDIATGRGVALLDSTTLAVWESWILANCGQGQLPVTRRRPGL